MIDVSVEALEVILAEDEYSTSCEGAGQGGDPRRGGPPSEPSVLPGAVHSTVGPDKVDGAENENRLVHDTAVPAAAPFPSRL
ncbi:hypothetical protein GCM10011374_39980 [Kocuria dechangensis]|uniref:Uncharacterized protein n=1 Tax=Kocuria dechangensis TaxID=1176249 RepID=A0A917H8T5_9MICC|nr:hypothetical protein GCM10011374_39980 [Kocuria dechangensis]